MAIRWIQFVVLEFKSTEAIFLFQMNEYGVLKIKSLLYKSLIYMLALFS